MALAQEHQHGPAASPPVASDDSGLPPLGSGPSVQMTGVLGAYDMMRDASGTSWQPESSMMDMIHGVTGDWATMLHGYAFGIYDHQGGPRGADKLFSESMLMGAAQSSVGPGRLTLRAMLSLDPLMGKTGYPLLLQTGETANGRTPLIDRQHPHDLVMELAAIYSVEIAPKTSAFLYAGYPGEPALGPPAFMHRFSGIDNPEAPIGHHWQDATHITFGVLTAGVVYYDWKIEGSVFTGREPDQNRWNFDRPRFDSASARLSWNPTSDLALQVSYGFIKSPEQLEPDVNQNRVTASAIYNRKIGTANWQTTLLWGQEANRPGSATNAYLLESAIRFDRHTFFGRAEKVQKDELFPAGAPRHGQLFDVSKVSIGYVYDIPLADHLSLGLGGLGSFYGLPGKLRPAYGGDPESYMIFTRIKLR